MILFQVTHVANLSARQIDAGRDTLADAGDHGEFRDRHYAAFHSGPSATADIEGVLIHGARISTA